MWGQCYGAAQQHAEHAHADAHGLTCCAGMPPASPITNVGGLALINGHSKSFFFFFSLNECPCTLCPGPLCMRTALSWSEGHPRPTQPIKGGCTGNGMILPGVCGNACVPASGFRARTRDGCLPQSYTQQWRTRRASENQRGFNSGLTLDYHTSVGLELCVYARTHT